MDNFIEPISIAMFFATIVLPVVAHNWVSDRVKGDVKASAMIFAGCVFVICLVVWGVVYHWMTSGVAQ